MTNEQALNLLAKVQKPRADAEKAYEAVYCYENHEALQHAQAREDYFLSWLDRKLRFQFFPYARG